MSKTLIIVTRKNDEFDSYWNGNITNYFEQTTIPKPVEISVNQNGNRVVIICPLFTNVDNNAVTFGERIKTVLSQSNIVLTEQSVGIIVHGSDTFNIDNAELPELAFRKRYSSSDKALGAKFCQSQNDNFISLGSQPDPPRTGVLDAFRDAYIFETKNLEEAFNNLWNFFLGDPVLEAKLNLLHLCLTPDGLKEAETLLQDDWNAEDKFEVLTEVKDKSGNTPDAFDDNYIKALTALRDALLI